MVNKPAAIVFAKQWHSSRKRRRCDGKLELKMCQVLLAIMYCKNLGKRAKLDPIKQS